MIRRARPGDIPALALLRGSVRENRLSDPARVGPGDYRRFVEGPGVWVWEEGGAILGFSAADPEDGSIWALFVDPAHEGRGIGRALLARACAVLREAGRSRARLSTDPGTRAERFYRRAGWSCAGTNASGEAVFEREL